jgi:hypothetical protein
MPHSHVVIADTPEHYLGISTRVAAFKIYRNYSNSTNHYLPVEIISMKQRNNPRNKVQMQWYIYYYIQKSNYQYCSTHFTDVDSYREYVTRDYLVESHCTIIESHLGSVITITLY